MSEYFPDSITQVSSVISCCAKLERANSNNRITYYGQLCQQSDGRMEGIGRSRLFIRALKVLLLPDKGCAGQKAKSQLQTSND
jgi:hypothetical protein